MQRLRPQRVTGWRQASIETQVRRGTRSDTWCNPGARSIQLAALARLTKLRIMVLDEADEMLDMGLPGSGRILAACRRAEDRAVFATMPTES